MRVLRLIGASLDPRRERFWQLLLAAGLVFRVIAVLVLRNPMDAIFSDPHRHWNNGIHFLNPDPQGASNPYVYQLYLFLVQTLTQKDRIAIGVVTAALSVSYPLIWYGFARSVLRRRVNALRVATILCWMPTHISMFGFFMNETLILPLVGLSLWMTKRAIDLRTAGSFVAASAAWTVSVLTRSIVGPVGLACVLVTWVRLRERRWLATTAACGITGVWLALASVHAHGVLKRYTPFGDNSVMAVYFASAAQGYGIDFKVTTNGFASPSFYLSPFTPFSDFPSIREGVFSFTADPDKHGEDVSKTLHEQVARNWKKLPRLVYENLVFLSFGHCWPAAGSEGDTADKICLWERWIWLPLCIVSFVGSAVYLARRRVEFVPLVAVGFLFSCFVLSQVAPMEGRYRKPFESLVVLTPIWLLERRKDPAPS